MINIRSLNPDTDLEQAVHILRSANAIVASKLGFNPENAPTNPAFITKEILEEQMNAPRDYYVFELNTKLVGMVALEKAIAEPEVFYVERLAVLPEYQQRGYGKVLMDFACDKAAQKGGRRVSIAIINENVQLKKWYGSLGFTESGIKKFEHLPFTVCFMKKELA